MTMTQIFNFQTNLQNKIITFKNMLLWYDKLEYSGICLKRTSLVRKKLSAFLERFFYEDLTVNHTFRSRVCVRCPLYTVSALHRFPV